MALAQPEPARARSTVYQALAEALAPPVLGIEELLLQATTTGAQVLSSIACRRAAVALAELPQRDLQALRNSYARLTTGLDHRPVALYESLHRYGRLAGPATWEVEAHYRTLGLTPLDGELSDHASVELAFLAHLAAAEAEAGIAGDGRLVARLRAEQRTFLRAHVNTWLPALGADLAAAEDPLYAIVGQLLHEFLVEESTGGKKARPVGTLLPTLTDRAGCTLCGLCVGSCPLGALHVVESSSETALTLSLTQCVGCDRCVGVCPEGVLALRPANLNGNSYHVMRRSPRATCPACGRPTVSQAELDAVFARLQPDPVTQQRLSLCVECKSWSV